MNKSKYVEEIEELNASDSSEQKPTKKSSRKSLKTIFIVILFILCVMGLAMIHKLRKEASVTLLPKTQMSSILNRKMPLLNTPKQTPVEKTVTDSGSGDTTISETKPDIPSNKTAAPIEQPITGIIVPIPAESDKVAMTVPVTTPTITSKPSFDYTLNDAITFKEHFLKGLPCESDYNKLLSARYKSSETQEVLNNLLPYCNGQQNTITNIRNVFLKNKKQALIAGYKEKSPKWIAYVKAVLVSVIEIRKLNPTTGKPKDIIYKAQNELYKQNIDGAAKLLRTLPAVMQEQMSDFFREAEIYVRADNSLNKLILSFENKGE